MAKTSTIIPTVAECLAAHPDILLGIVYGSASAGTMRADSDVDVAVLAEAPLSLEARLDIILELSLALGREVDVIDLHTAHGLILRQILTKGAVALKRSTVAYARLMKRMLFDHADMEPMRRTIVHNSLQRGF
ncbi:nucleotidyltransferase domain-containing protein [Desulfobaculum sp. SPO524]|uniref:type VII toxin-antitoxin system MntA family adenylyltransferase antitoxin n=1 Tax=Desulfobaculum sp. SPO524 TaxID=3378071 RepID=UPI003852A848